MVRTQIHLSDEDVAALDRVARETGASRSELIRRAVREKYGAARQRPRSVSFGVARGSAFPTDPEEIDAELAKIYEERYRRWHG
jgi:metal-responsive CopG/Arc/MetJ family transcriptional regulator